MIEKYPVVAYPKLDPEKVPFEKLLRRFQKVQSFCLQAGTCTDIGKGDPGLVCELKTGKEVDRACFAEGGCRSCPLNKDREEVLKIIRRKLDPWWKKILP